MSPVISVILPMHNAGRYIADALRSLQAQSVERWEALVIDDGSTDDGGAIVDAIARRDKRVSRIGSVRRGVGAARNAGIELTRGDYLLFLDADDWMMSGSLELLLTAAEQTEHGAAYGSCAWFAQDATPLGFTSECSCAEAGRAELLEFNRFPVHGAILRRSTLGAMRFDPELPGLEDWDLWIRLALAGVSWKAVDRDVAAYRLISGSRSRDYRAIASAARTVLSRAFASASADAREASALLRDPERQRRVIVRHVLEAATASAFGDPTPGCERAASILRMIHPAREIRGEDAALAALWGVPSAACLAPVSWAERAREYAVVVDRWWRRVVREGWAEENLLEEARQQLAARCITPDRIVDRLCEEVDPKRPVVLLGLGQNGRRLGRRLLAMGLRPLAMDDSVPAAGRLAELEGGSIPVRGGIGVLGDGAQYIVTPEDDGSIVGSLPVCLDVRRWSEARAELAREGLIRFLVSWPIDPGAARAWGAAA